MKKSMLVAIAILIVAGIAQAIPVYETFTGITHLTRNMPGITQTLPDSGLFSIGTPFFGILNYEAPDGPITDEDRGSFVGGFLYIEVGDYKYLAPGLTWDLGVVYNYAPLNLSEAATLLPATRMSYTRLTTGGPMVFITGDDWSWSGWSLKPVPEGGSTFMLAGIAVFVLGLARQRLTVD